MIADLLDVVLMVVGLQLLDWRHHHSAGARALFGVAGLLAIRAVPLWQWLTGR